MVVLLGYDTFMTLEDWKTDEGTHHQLIYSTRMTRFGTGRAIGSIVIKVGHSQLIHKALGVEGHW